MWCGIWYVDKVWGGEKAGHTHLPTLLHSRLTEEDLLLSSPSILGALFLGMKELLLLFLCPGLGQRVLPVVAVRHTWAGAEVDGAVASLFGRQQPLGERALLGAPADLEKSSERAEPRLPPRSWRMTDRATIARVRRRAQAVEGHGDGARARALKLAWGGEGPVFGLERWPTLRLLAKVVGKHAERGQHRDELEHDEQRKWGFVEKGL